MFQLDKVLKDTEKPVKARGTIKTKRWQSFVCYTTCRSLQYMPDLEVERIWGTVLDLESVAVSSSVWYNVLVFLLLEGKKNVKTAVAFESSSQCWNRK